MNEPGAGKKSGVGGDTRRRFLGNTLSNIGGLAAPLVVGAIALPFITRTLGASEFGILGLAWALLSYFTLFDLGLGRAVAHTVALRSDAPSDLRLGNFVVTAMVFHLILGVVGGVALGTAASLLAYKVLRIPAELRPMARDSFMLLAPGVPLVLLGGMYRGVLEGLQRFDVVNVVRGPLGALLFAVPAVGGVLGAGIVPIVAVMVIVRGIGTFAYYRACRSLLPPSTWKGRLNKDAARELLTFGGWISVSNFATPVLQNLDRLTIASVAGVAQAGYYTGAYELMKRSSIIPASVSGVMFPAVSASGGNAPVARERIYSRSLNALLIAMVPMLVSAINFESPILTLMLGAEYADRAGWAFTILCFGAIANSLANVPFTYLQASGRPDIPAKLHAAEVVPFALIIFILTKRMGITGAAIAWATRAVVDSAFQFVASWRTSPVVLSQVFSRRMIGTYSICLAFVIAVVGSHIMFRGQLGAQAILWACSATAFGIAAWRWGLNDQERHLLRSFAMLASQRHASTSGAA